MRNILGLVKRCGDMPRCVDPMKNLNKFIFRFIKYVQQKRTHVSAEQFGQVIQSVGTTKIGRKGPNRTLNDRSGSIGPLKLTRKVKSGTFCCPDCN